MKCDKYKKDFEEKDLHESHDVPCYLFEGNRKVSKNKADKFGRHWLCNNREDGCHKKYEKSLNELLKKNSLQFSKEFFKEDKNG